MGTSTSAASLRAAKVARVASTTSATLRMSRTGTAAIVRRSDAGSAVCVETSAILSSLHAGFLADSTCSRCHGSCRGAEFPRMRTVNRFRDALVSAKTRAPPIARSAAAAWWRLRPAAVQRADAAGHAETRSEEHTSELQALMRNHYAVFSLK